MERIARRPISRNLDQRSVVALLGRSCSVQRIDLSPFFRLVLSVGPGDTSRLSPILRLTMQFNVMKVAVKMRIQTTTRCPKGFKCRIGMTLQALANITTHNAFL